MALKPKRRRVAGILLLLMQRLIADLDNDITSGINHEMADTFKQVVTVLDSDDEANWSPFQNSVYTKVDDLGAAMETSEDPPTAEYNDLLEALS